jgi:hypothetical protein
MFEVHGSTDAAFARLKEEKRDQAPAS